MNIKREGSYLTAFSGVALTSIGLGYLLYGNTFAVTLSQEIQFSLLWMSVGVLFFLNGIYDMFSGLQEIIEDFRAKKNEKMTKVNTK